MEKEAEKILNNIIDLAELLDEETLRNAADVPIVELAKAVSIKKLRKKRKTETPIPSLPRGQKPDEAGSQVPANGRHPRQR